MTVKITARQQITNVAETILKSHPDGLRWGQLMSQAKKKLPLIPPNTIAGNMHALVDREPKKFIKTQKLGERAKYKLREYASDIDDSSISSPKKIRDETRFYRAFADYLENGESDSHPPECTKAYVVGGGSRKRGKWGTPDVVGVFKKSHEERVEFPHEIVSAEIKDKGGDIIEGFGQACTYRLFSHKTYLVIPRLGNETNEARLESLCLVFGIGLVYFDSQQEEIDDSMFTVKLPAQRHSPNMFYVNKFIVGKIEQNLYPQ